MKRPRRYLPRTNHGETDHETSSVSYRSGSEFQSVQNVETDLTEPDSDPPQQPRKQHKADTVTVISNLSLQQIAAQYGDDPPVISKVNLSDISKDYGKSKDT